MMRVMDKKCLRRKNCPLNQLRPSGCRKPGHCDASHDACVFKPRVQLFPSDVRGTDYVCKSQHQQDEPFNAVRAKKSFITDPPMDPFAEDPMIGIAIFTITT